jgi:hypothetical protein
MGDPGEGSASLYPVSARPRRFNVPSSLGRAPCDTSACNIFTILKRSLMHAHVACGRRFRRPLALWAPGISPTNGQACSIFGSGACVQE